MMDTERTIGRVVKVKTYQALVELQSDTSSYVKSSHGGLYAIAVINSYVIIPIGSERVVAIVTGLDMVEEQEARFQNKQMLVLPQSRRTMWVSMVGTISQAAGSTQKEFDFGIRKYPELDNPVWFAAEEDLDVIFEKHCLNEEREERLVSIGKSPLFPDYDVKIDMDKFFGKHAAILGNTGSGKSCTITALLRAVLEKRNGNGMPHAHFIIFDTNAEYESAFTRVDRSDETMKEFLFNRYVISNEGDDPTGFWLPHWFMNGRDYTAFFRPGEGAQAPLLHRAIETARSQAQGKSSRIQILTTIEQSVQGIQSFVDTPPQGGAGYYARKNLREMLSSLLALLDERLEDFNASGILLSRETYKTTLNLCLQSVGADDGYLNAVIIDGLSRSLQGIKEQLVKDLAHDDSDETVPIGVDSPVYFDFDDFVTKVIRGQIEREAEHNANLRNWIGPLILRLEQSRHDPRYAFLFKVKYFTNPLASFLRLVFGVNPTENFEKENSFPPWGEAAKKQYPNPQSHHQITILDFSQLASDVLENVTALIGRIILEFMQRCPQRGNYPVVLILEEAHHYIPAEANLERQLRAREVFERIAKEGRKYGLSLVVASQRPSELSRTVLAQCNSFIVHRIQNPDDQQYFRAVISGLNRDLLDQLPTLPQQHALIIGDCITVPLQVRVNDVDPKPDSHDPEFFKIWSDPKSIPPDFESISAKWEGIGGLQRNGFDKPASSAIETEQTAPPPVAEDDDLPF